MVEERRSLSSYKYNGFIDFNVKKVIKSSLKIVKKLEDMGAYWPVFGKVYCRFFYTKLVEKELKHSGLEKGSSILHIGCGSLPMTVLNLSQLGYSVVGIDSDEKAVKHARKVIKRRKKDKNIRILGSNGKAPEIKDFDAIWVSLHAIPKKRLIKSLLNKLEVGQKLVFRNPRGCLDLVYPRIEVVDPFFSVKKITHNSIETVIVEKI